MEYNLLANGVFSLDKKTLPKDFLCPSVIILEYITNDLYNEVNSLFAKIKHKCSKYKHNLVHLLYKVILFLPHIQ